MINPTTRDLEVPDHPEIRASAREVFGRLIGQNQGLPRSY